MAPVRSVAKADVAELAAVLDTSVEQEPDHHLVIVAAKQSLSTTQFKQMFYSRGDDFFQIANVYECPDSGDSVRSSVWGIDPQNARHSVGGLEGYEGDDGTTEGGPNSAGGGAATIGEGGQAATTATANTTTVPVYNFNKLGGRHDDPPGTQHAYGYAHDPSRSFFAQHEVMGFLEQDVCVKRDNWTACSRMSIEDQLYSLAFASETDQDLCLKVTCARRWSEVEDALAESCTAADQKINMGATDADGAATDGTGDEHVDLFINVRVTNGHPKALDTILRVRFHVEYRRHEPSVRNTWNTRASEAASGVITDGVVGDAPEGGKLQHEDTTVVVH